MPRQMMQNRLNAYQQRKNKIKQAEHELAEMKSNHAQLTRQDFGIADGDQITIDNLVSIFKQFQAEKENSNALREAK